ncbi:MAG: protein translocase subunit SecD [Myxococcota bacterium]
MEQSWYLRTALIVGLVGLGIYISMPSFIYLTSEPKVRRDKQALKKAIPDFLPENRVNLGIDLQGGLHLMMGVDTEKAATNRADRIGDEIAEKMKEKGKPTESVRRPTESPLVRITMKDAGDWDTLKGVLDDHNDTWDLVSHSGVTAEIEMKPQYVQRLKEDAVNQAIKTLRNRIDGLGVSEPEVRKSGDESILIQIAGLTADEERSVKDGVIGKTAQLEFKMVDDESKYFAEIAAQAPASIKMANDTYQGVGDSLVSPPYLYAKSRDELAAFIQAHPPGSDRVVSYSKIKEGTESEAWRTWLLDRKTPLTGDSIVSAYPSVNNDDNAYYVALKLDKAGGVIFEQLTAANVRKRVAIVLDDIVDSAPIIQNRIPNGNVSITLGGGKPRDQVLKDAQALSVVLNAGALPAPVFPQEERTVGATLGDDAVAKGKNALLAAILVTLIVMVGYYRLSGVFAVLSMLVNMLLLFAVLAMIKGTLSLPGLAGLALTVGMAVDANIIQFERIREELRLGKTVRAAVDGGFDKAFSAIFDSNATTALSAVVLMQYGSGPIKGFAVTLLVGVVINTFTAVVVPRLCLEYLTRGRRVQELSI